MTLQELTTPFERRRVIEYGADGNKVVRHWHDVQHVVGSLYKSKDTQDEQGTVQCKLYIFFPDVNDGWRFQNIYGSDHFTVEQMREYIEQSRVDSASNMVCMLNDRMKQNQFIGSSQIEFVRQFNDSAAARFAKYRMDLQTRKDEMARQEHQRRQKEYQAKMDAEKKREQAKLDAEKAKYFGWADAMTPLRFGKVAATLDRLVYFNGKAVTKRDFVIDRVRNGWTPEKEENVVRWGWRDSKPKTEYYICKDNLSYKVNKTEFDFAVYLTEHMEVLK